MAKINKNTENILNERYYYKDPTTGKTLENKPEQMFRRVANWIARAEETEKLKEEYEEIFYNLMDEQLFMPNTPTLIGSGYLNKCLSACSVLGQIPDNLPGIYEYMAKNAMLTKSGCGVGQDLSIIRPKGELIKSSGGISAGVVNWMYLINTVATTTIQGDKARRAANMVSLRFNHPDIFDFINSKKNDKTLSAMNISVTIKNYEIKAALEGKSIDLIWNNKIYATINAKTILDNIVANMYNNGEPGILFIDTINDGNPFNLQDGKFDEDNSYYMDTTNPCLSGDTIIAVADGRNGIAIQQLAKEGNKFPVYSARTTPKGNWKAEIKYATAFKSGHKKVIEVILSNGTKFTCTPDHKIATKDGRWIEAQYTKNEILENFYTFSDKNSLKNYRNIKTKTNAYNRQYRMIWEFLNDRYDGKKFNINHKDEIATHDSINNLELITIDDHKKITKRNGNNNPLFKMSYDRRVWINRKRNILANATRYNWGEDRLKDVMNTFILENPQPITQDKNIYLDHDIKVIDIIFTNEIIDVYDLTVEDNHNFYIITNTDDDNFLNCSGVLVHNCGEQVLQGLRPGRIVNGILKGKSEGFELCNLGSINISSLYNSKTNEINWKKFEYCIKNSIRFLDDVITVNYYPLPEAELLTKGNRKIGLGVAGLAELFIKMGIRYDSQEALIAIDKIFSFKKECEIKYNTELGIEKGNFINWGDSIFGKKNIPARCATISTQAPTGSIANILGLTSYGIEPFFAVVYMRKIMETEFIEGMDIFKDMLKRDLKSDKKVQEALDKCFKAGTAQIEEVPEGLRDLFRCANDISPEWHIKIQAQLQKYYDNAISKTVNAPENTKIEDIYNIIKLAWESNIKGYTYYRNNSRDGQTMQIGEEKHKGRILKLDSIEPLKRSEFGKTYGITERKATACGTLYVTVNRDVDGNIVEMFVNTSKNGTCKSNIDGMNRMTSLALRSGVKVEEIIDQLKGINCAACARSRGKGNEISGLSCPDIIAKVIEEEYKGFISQPIKKIRKSKETEEDIKNPCPECGKPLSRTEGCYSCLNCGYSKCS